mmetsp:Transcript_55666/g.172531  ORF Transcript_55666/g.172531 Transcript_55666/m.172531 type:complete len:201 (-) Transcript_55666:471-1073(-)
MSSATCRTCPTYPRCKTRGSGSRPATGTSRRCTIARTLPTPTWSRLCTSRSLAGPVAWCAHCARPRPMSTCRGIWATPHSTRPPLATTWKSCSTSPSRAPSSGLPTASEGPRCTRRPRETARRSWTSCAPPAWTSTPPRTTGAPRFTSRPCGAGPTRSASSSRPAPSWRRRTRWGTALCTWPPGTARFRSWRSCARPART